MILIQFIGILIRNGSDCRDSELIWNAMTNKLRTRVQIYTNKYILEVVALFC